MTKRVHLAEIVAPIAGVANMLIWFLVTRLPEPMTTNWGLLSGPRGRLPQLAFLGVYLAGWCFCWAWIWRARVRQSTGRWGEVGPMYANATAIIVTFGLTLWANHGLETWRGADRITVHDWLYFAGACVIVWHVVNLARRLADAALPWLHERLPVTVGASNAGARAGERVVWSRAIRPQYGLGFLPFLTVVSIGAPLEDVLALAALVVIVMHGLAKLWHAKVIVSSGGVVVHTGGSKHRVPLDEITSADVQWLAPADYEGGMSVTVTAGGAGYRLRLVAGHGEALHLQTTKGEVLVTVPRAREAAGVINDLRGRPLKAV